MRRRTRTGIQIGIAVGLLSGLFFLAQLLIAEPRPNEMSFSEVVTPTSADFLPAVSGVLNAPVSRGGYAEILVNGKRFLPALIEAIDGAERSVHFATYVWSPGEMSDQIFAALERAASRGVVVRLLLDGHGARDLDEDATRALEDLGGHVATFRPLSPGWLLEANQRNHRRAIVMDGETAFTGGAGVADEWLGDGESPDRWRDDLIQVSGPMARSVQSAFCDLWVRATGEVLSGADVFPPEPKEKPGGERVALHLSVVGTPSSDHTPMRSLFWASFRAAQTRIWITNPYVVPAESIVSVLGDRARAGVDVRILTAGDHSDIAVVRWAGRHNYEALLAAGVRVYEYQPTLIHSKNIVIDGVWSLVGSANLDLRSTQLNEEIVLAIHDVSFATELEEVFRNDLARAREIDPDEWARRGAYARIREKLGFLLQEQL